jgi:iron complex outermembrane receptor protein
MDGDGLRSASGPRTPRAFLADFRAAVSLPALCACIGRSSLWHKEFEMELKIQSASPFGVAVLAILVGSGASAQPHLPGPIEEIQVIGTPHRESPSELAQSVTVLRDAALARAQSGTLGETLAGELGVSASSFGAGASRPVIRGLAGTRVRTLQDGIDTLDVSTVSDDHAVGVDPLVAEQIEIFRGPTTLLYGSGAVGGVVNTVTRRIPEQAPDDGFEGNFQLGGDTVAGGRSGALSLDGGSDSIAWHFDALRRETDDYEIPGFAEAAPDDPDEAQGLLENSSTETGSYAMGASWLGERGFFGASFSGFDSDYGVPGHAHGHDEHEGEDHEEEVENPDEEDELVRIDLKQRRIDLKGGWSDLDGFIEGMNLRLGINDYTHTELEGGETGTLFENQAYEARAELMHRPWGEWTGAFGLQIGAREFSAVGDEAYIPPVDTDQLGLFVLEGRSFGAWDLSVGGRLESVEHRPSAAVPTVNDTVASASLAGVRRLGEAHALAVHVALAERAPVAEELYSNGPHLASQTVEVGDTSLGVETSRHVDLGFRRTMGDLTWSITAFLTSFDDFIYLSDTGVIDEESELEIFEYTQQDATLKGVEAELFVPIRRSPSGELDLRLMSDYVQAELSSGEKLPRLPPLRYGARLQWHNDFLIAGLEAMQHADQDRIAPFETPTEGFTMLTADLDWRISERQGRALRLLIRGSNLLDEDARRSTSLIKDIAPLPGRNISVALRASF